MHAVGFVAKRSALVHLQSFFVSATWQSTRSYDLFDGTKAVRLVEARSDNKTSQRIVRVRTRQVRTCNRYGPCHSPSGCQGTDVKNDPHCERRCSWDLCSNLPAPAAIVQC